MMRQLTDHSEKQKKALLVVSFGTSYPDTCERTIGAIERDLKAAFPERTFRRAWTSAFIRRKVERDQGIRIPDVSSALERMAENGITDVLVQPTHMLDALENRAMTETIHAKKNNFERIRCGKPLLCGDADLREIAEVFPGIFPGIGSEELLLLMGHGSHEDDNSAYLKINDFLRTSGHGNMRIILVDAHPDLEDVLPEIRKRAPKRIVLTPFMVVAGAHARKDLAGDTQASWKQALRDYPMEILLKGMGEYPEIRKIYVRHAKEADACL